MMACAAVTQHRNVISLRDVPSGQVFRLLGYSKGSIQEMVFDPSGRQLATIDELGDMKLWNTVTGQLKRTFSGEAIGAEGENLQYDASFSEDGRVISLVTIPLGRQALADI